MKKTAIAAACLLGIITPLAAQEENAAANSAVKIAEDYLAAYSTFKIDKMAPFLAEDAIFSDPTSTDQTADGGSFMFTGKAAILKGLGDYAAQYKDFFLEYDLERQYESNGVVIFVGRVNYTVLAPDDQTYTGGAPIVTAVTVSNGKVIKHLDLYDYSGNAKEFSD